MNQFSRLKKYPNLNKMVGILLLCKVSMTKFVGFILLRRAFSPDIAAACREQLWQRLKHDGVLRNDKKTWLKRIGIPEVYKSSLGHPWDQVLTPRLRNAIDQLCGSGRWQDFGCGWWVITFPGQEDGPWGASGKWHVDGAHYRHHINSKQSGLLPIFLFSTIGNHGGGTLLRKGSHRLAASLLIQNEPDGLRGSELSRQLISLSDECPVVEVNGEEGDVMLTHPFLLHARSKNFGPDVRFMCNPNVSLFTRMNFPANALMLEKHAMRNRHKYTPVERCIVDSILSGN